jgi:SAM-dependent methyltransferase
VSAIVGALHRKFVLGRRVRILASHLCRFLPPNARVLDVGCGDGAIDALIQNQRPDVSIEGIDVFVRPSPLVPVRLFDGTTIPYGTRSFDVVMFVDVLHHMIDPLVLLREGVRVGKIIVIKDHFRDGFLAGLTLRLMDWVGNTHQGAIPPCSYWSERQWTDAFRSLGLEVRELIASLGLYPSAVAWLFERRLHFIAVIQPDVMDNSVPAAVEKV